MAYNTLKNIPATIQSSLGLKADLVDGEIPSEQLPDEIDARVSVLNGTDAALATEILALGELAAPTDGNWLRKGDGVTPGGGIVGLQFFTSYTGQALVNDSDQTETVASFSNLPSGIYKAVVFGSAFDSTANLIVNTGSANFTKIAGGLSNFGTSVTGVGLSLICTGEAFPVSEGSFFTNSSVIEWTGGAASVIFENVGQGGIATLNNFGVTLERIF
jgi:hypothetical protein